MAVNLKKPNIILIIVLAFFFSCKSSEYNPKLVDYLNAEREMRKRVSQGLEDSLYVLQKNFKIDLKKELKKIEKNPEAWTKLLKAIDGEK
ncbi:MAG: hypothetical protein ABIL69_01915 [candidate division WOR-3 bacterium]